VGRRGRLLLTLVLKRMSQRSVGGPDGSLSALLGRHGAMNPAGRVGITKYCGLGLEKDAVERIGSTRGKYEPGKEEPRVGGCAGLRASKGG
jgi:hypothetical protein